MAKLNRRAEPATSCSAFGRPRCPRGRWLPTLAATPIPIGGTPVGAFIRTARSRWSAMVRRPTGCASFSRGGGNDELDAHIHDAAANLGKSSVASVRTEICEVHDGERTRLVSPDWRSLIGVKKTNASIGSRRVPLTAKHSELPAAIRLIANLHAAPATRSATSISAPDFAPQI